jgi:ATP-dependent Zn protease
MNSQHTWICVICGAGFTRKSSANRHNQNLHTGNGTIVRPLEYIIGRLNGKFHEPKDTLLFRKNNNNTRIQNNDLNPLMYTHEITIIPIVIAISIIIMIHMRHRHHILKYQIGLP